MTCAPQIVDEHYRDMDPLEPHFEWTERVEMPLVQELSVDQLVGPLSLWLKSVFWLPQAFPLSRYAACSCLVYWLYDSRLRHHNMHASIGWILLGTISMHGS